LIEAVIGGGFALICLFISYCIYEVRKVKRDVINVVKKEKFEIIVQTKRADVLDRVVSEISEEKFNSRDVVEKGHAIPNIHKKLIKLIHS
jgi:hypothetical protein